MTEPLAYAWDFVPRNIRDVYEAAMAIDRAAPSSIDSTWQEEGSVQIPIREIIRLRKALR